MADSWYYVWKPSIGGATIELSLAVIEKLKDLVDCSRPNSDPDEPERIVERGGFLIGRAGEDGTVIVDDFAEVASDHPRGASFTLSQQKRRALGHRLESLTKQGRTPVGYFRSHSRPGLYLDQDDDAVVRELFSEPWQMVLLAKCAAREEPVAGIFLWNEGEMDRRSPDRPFSLDASELWTSDSTIEERPRPGFETPAARVQWTNPAMAVRTFVLTAVFVPALVLMATGLWTNLRQRPHVINLNSVRELKVSEAQSPVSEDTWTPPTVSTPVTVASHPKPSTQPPIHRRRAAAVHRVTNPRRPRGSATRLFEPDISLEPVRQSALRRTLGHIPLISKLDPGHSQIRSDFVPAHSRRQAGLVLPDHFSFGSEPDGPVDLRIHISRRGDVASTVLLSHHSNPQLANLALRTASKWDFSPARVKDKAVASDMLVHFRFRPATQPALLQQSSIQPAPDSAQPGSH